ncbi:AfsR/SARP family transcriptional regulator [Couchioplanes caeruleus]|uniref:AfsR/SARP family transcriptional regulator n=1 Tax=Couchioplanes caeruleus TaxID=56438 RepID=UPI0014768874|nr:BTAD domain-containing putative transcriptional regulator [Couchioplanes caeruleus]
MVTIAGRKQRMLLLALLTHANDWVSSRRLAEILWSATPPRSAMANLKTYVWGLRQTLPATSTGADRIEGRRSEYRIVADKSELDLFRFTDLVARGREADGRGDLATAGKLLQEAVELWRGPFAEGLDGTDALFPESGRLTEDRWTATEEWIDALLRLGQHTEVLRIIRGLLADQPLRERLWHQMMLALYRSGRRAESLAAYHDLYETLDRELGISPGPDVQQLHQRILRDDPALLQARPARDDPPARGPQHLVPSHLPPDLASFTGRLPELGYIVGAWTRDETDQPAQSVVCAIDGMAGVGKTTLAVHAAHQMLPWFPDGQFFLDLHGYTPDTRPVDPSDALDRLLRALGLTSQQIPNELEDRSALFRSMLRGRRMLLLLDNAADERQVAPLLPANPGCFVLITGRRQMTGLDDLRSVSLAVLPLADAVALFSRASGDQRPVREPEAVQEVVELCDRLPLAIRVAAARLQARPTWAVSHLADRLRDFQHRLTELESGPRSVTAALQVSYAHLSGDQKRMFRLLGVHPGPDLTAAAAAALIDRPLREADRLLQALVDMHLLWQDNGQRYRMHDLIRQHARQLAESEESAPSQRDAIGRLLDYWVHVGGEARARTRSGRSHPVAHPGYLPHQYAPRFTTPEQAMDWLTEERRNLLAGVRYAARRSLHQHTSNIARALRTVFYMRGEVDDWMAIEKLAVEASRRLDDPLTLAESLQSLGMAYWAVGDNDATLGHLDEALETLRRAGDLSGEAEVLITIGMVLIRMGRPREALARERKALRISGQVKDLHTEARARMILGLTFWRLGDYPAALDNASRSLTIYTERGSKRWQADALNVAGIVYARLADDDKAVDHAKRALALSLETGYHRGSAWGLNLLGSIRVRQQRHKEALDHLRRATRYARDCSDQRIEAHSLSLIGIVLAELGDHRAALECQEQAFALCRHSGDLGLECEIHNEAGAAQRLMGDGESALNHHRLALEMSDEVGDPYEAARALEGAAHALHSLGNTAAADERLRRAKEKYTELSVPAAWSRPSTAAR